jgi:hypothetical protein
VINGTLKEKKRKNYFGTFRHRQRILKVTGHTLLTPVDKWSSLYWDRITQWLMPGFEPATIILPGFQRPGFPEVLSVTLQTQKCTEVFLEAASHSTGY